MKYQRYKYKEEDIATLIELATKSNLACAQVYKDGVWPFSINVLNVFLVGRRVATTDRLKVAIVEYKASYAKFAGYTTLSEGDIQNVVSLRTEGLSFAEISKRTGLKIGFIMYIVSGNMRHPAAPKRKIIASAKRGRKRNPALKTPTAPK